jgi:hypothetical protein
MRCMSALCRRWGVVDPDEHEIAAIAAASPMAGEYLDSIGKTDLAVLTEAEWLTLLEVIITAYQDELPRRCLAARARRGPGQLDPGGRTDQRLARPE